MKESAVLLVGPILLAALAVQGVRRAWPLFVGPALFASSFAAKNLLLGLPVGSTFQPYATGGTAEGLWGSLVDPQRGLAWFAPLALTALLAWPWLAPRPATRAVTAAAAAMAVQAYWSIPVVDLLLGEPLVALAALVVAGALVAYAGRSPAVASPSPAELRASRKVGAASRAAED